MEAPPRPGQSRRSASGRGRAAAGAGRLGPATDAALPSQWERAEAAQRCAKHRIDPAGAAFQAAAHRGNRTARALVAMPLPLCVLPSFMGSRFLPSADAPTCLCRTSWLLQSQRGGRNDTEASRTMPWTRLDPGKVAQQLRAGFDRPGPDDAVLTEKALAHLRQQLLSGAYIAVQDHTGSTFIGTPEEAMEHMMGHTGA